MKLRITNLKAPWPSGAKVGDIVEVPAVPAWAVGKCERAPDDTKATLSMAAPATAAGDAPARLEAANRAATDALKLADEARVQLADAQAALDASKAEADELRKQLAEAMDALAKATEPQSKKK